MNRAFSLLPLFLTVPLAASMAAPATAAKAPIAPKDMKTLQELQDLQRRFQTATRTKDLSGVMSLMTPDFTRKMVDGRTLNRKQVEDGMRQYWPGVKSYGRWDLGITKLKVTGDTAVGTVEERMYVVVTDERGVGVPYMAGSASRDTWVRTAGGWKYKRIEEIWQDQQPVTPQAPQSLTFVPAKKLAAEARRAQAGSTISAAAARKMLEKYYAGYRQAVIRKDINAAMNGTAPDFMMIYPVSVQTREQAMESLRGEMRMTRQVKEWRITVKDVKVKGNTITALLQEHKVSLLADAKGKVHTSRLDDTTQDTWVKTPNGWKTHRTRVRSATFVVDGRVVRKI